ncbi:Rp2, partial [Symbiodinium sp. KB8]
MAQLQADLEEAKTAAEAAEGLRRQVEELEAQAEQDRDLMDTLSEQIKNLERESSDSNDLVSQLRKENKTLTAKLEDIESKYDSEVNSLAVKLETERTKADGLQSELNDMRKQAVKEREEKNSLEAHMAQLTSRVSELEKELASPPTSAQIPGTSTSHAAQAEEQPPSPAKGFNDRSAYRKYMFRTYYCVADKEDETIIKQPGQVDGQQFQIQNVKGCKVIVADHTGPVQVDDCEGCEIVIGPSNDSVFIRSCTDCVIAVAARQVRTRDCSNVVLFMYSGTDPIIETSTELQVAPWNVSYPGLREQFAAAGLVPEKNHWKHIFDFNKDDSSIPFPHWSELAEEDRQVWDLQEVEGDGVRENPVPADALAASDTAVGGEGGEDKSGWMSFDIKTTSQADVESKLAEQQGSDEGE